MFGTAAARHIVVFISPYAEEHASLRRIFRDSQWELQDAYTSQDGLRLLSRNQDETPVVICEHSLPDGDWKCLLAELDKMPVRPSLIVSSRLADGRLWAEVLSLGAFDLLVASPFAAEEVLRVTESAWLASIRASERGDVPRQTPEFPHSLGNAGVSLVASSGL